MVDTPWTTPELARAFLDFREEMRDEVKWIRRMLIGVLVSAVLSSLVSSTFVVVTRG